MKFPSSFNLRRLIASTSIRNKLFMMVVALLLVYMANASLTINNALNETRGKLNLLADITSKNIEASLLFKDGNGTQ